MGNPEPARQPTPYERFVAVTRRILSVSKEELEKREVASRKFRARRKVATEEAELVNEIRSGSARDVKDATQKQFFRVWSAARPQYTVGAKILMDKGDLDTLKVKICENLTPGA